MATNNAVNTGLSGASGTGSFAGTNSPTFSTLINVDNLRLAGNTISSTDVNGNITHSPNGTGVSFFTKDVHLETSANPSIRIYSEDLARTSYTDIIDVATTQLQINKATTGGVSNLDLNPMPLNGTSSAIVRVFRNTNTTGLSSFQVFKANNTSTVNCRLGCNTDSFVCADNSNFGVGNNAPGAKLHVTGNAWMSGVSFDSGTNVLANYVDRTAFTPVATFSTPGDLAVVYTNQTGEYLRVGDMVFVNILLNFTPTYTTSAGQFRITGLPLTIVSDGSGGVIWNLTANTTFPAGTSMLSGVFNVGGNDVLIRSMGSATAPVDLTVTNVPSGVNHIFRVTGFYFAA